MLSAILPTASVRKGVMIWASQKLDYLRPDASDFNLHSFISFLDLMVNDGAAQFDYLTE